MPTVPEYGDRKVQPGALPSARQSGPGAAVETPQSEGAAIGGALQDLGTTGARLGLQFGELEHQHQEEARQRRRQLFELNATRRANESLESALMDDEHGVLKARGMEVMPRAQRARVQWEQDMGAIAKDAQDDDERLIAEHIKVNYSARLADTIDRHQDTELREYDKNEFAGLQASAERTIIAAATTSPAAAILTLHTTEDQVRKYAARNGLGPAATTDMVADVNNRLASAAVLEVLQKGNPVLAQALMEQFTPSAHTAEGQTPDPSKDILTGETRLKLEEAVKRGLTEDAGETLADEIWKAVAPKKAADNDEPINLAQMEDLARDRTRGDPDLFKAVRSALRERKSATDDTRREMSSKVNETLWGMARDGRSYAQIARTPEAIANPKLALEVRDYLQAKADQGEARQERDLTDRGWPEYFRLSQPEELAKMSIGEASAQLPTIGHQLTARLVGDVEQYQRAKAAGEKQLQALIGSAKMDRENLLREAEKGGFPYAFNPVTKQQRGTLSRLQAAADDEVKRETAARGRALSSDEQLGVFHRILDNQITIDYWGSDVAMPAAVVEADDVPNAYVPFDTIPWRHKNELLQHLRSLNPAFQGLDDKQLRARRGIDHVIERAYAAYQLGLGDEELEARLREAH